MTIYDFKKISDLSRDNCYVKKVAFHGTATAGGVTYIGGQLSYESYIDMAELILSGHVVGDRYDFAVTLPHPVTPTDLSTDIVLWTYGANLAVKATVEGQGEAGAPYLMLLGTDKRMRLKYTSTGLVNVAVSMHFRTHIPKDVLGG
jgi:hypothetical protein